MKPQLEKLLRRLIEQKRNLDSVLANPDPHTRDDLLKWGLGMNADDAELLLRSEGLTIEGGLQTESGQTRNKVPSDPEGGVR